MKCSLFREIRAQLIGALVGIVMTSCASRPPTRYRPAQVGPPVIIAPTPIGQLAPEEVPTIAVTAPPSKAEDYPTIGGITFITKEEMRKLLDEQERERNKRLPPPRHIPGALIIPQRVWPGPEGLPPVNSYYRGVHWLDDTDTLKPVQPAPEEPPLSEIRQPVARTLQQIEQSLDDYLRRTEQPFAVVRVPENFRGTVESYVRGARRIVVEYDEHGKPTQFLLYRNP